MLSARLVLASGVNALGPNLKRCDDPENIPEGRDRISATVRVAYLKCDPISAVASFAGGLLGFPVVDETQLTGLWTAKLVYEPNLVSAERRTASVTAPPVADALKEQLGLRLESTRGPVRVIVVDSVQQPTEN